MKSGGASKDHCAEEPSPLKAQANRGKMPPSFTDCRSFP